MPSIITKIVAWLMIVFGVIGILDLIITGFADLPFRWPALVVESINSLLGPDFPDLLGFVLILIFYVGTFFSIPISLLRKKRWAWWFGITALFMSLIFLFFLPRTYLSLYHKEQIWNHMFYPFVLLIFLFLDRKNFFKIAL